LESVRDREQRNLERKVGSLDDDFVLFGAGNLGRKVIRILRGIGKRPIAFIDNNPDLWGKKLEGIPIMSPPELASQVDPSKVGVMTTIWCGEATDKMSDRIGPLTQLGFCKVGLFGHLAWKFPDAFLPYYSLDLPSKVIENSDRIMMAFELLADDASRDIFVNHIEWRLFLDYDVLPFPSTEEIYFNRKFVSVNASEVLYDIGAYTGDSLKSFLSTRRGEAFSEIHSFEPSPRNFERLQRYVASLGTTNGKLFVHRLALGEHTGEIQVETESGPASRVGRGAEIVPITTIDEFGHAGLAPTFVKIDIEGFEPQCLAGAKRTIADSSPVVAVCVYHLQSHIWDIVIQLHSYSRNYSFRLCPHVADGWDLVLYAVPETRLPSHSMNWKVS
jgi:FkbM family methyltransferase